MFITLIDNILVSPNLKFFQKRKFTGILFLLNTFF